MADGKTVDIYSDSSAGKRKHTVIWVLISLAAVLTVAGGFFGPKIYQEIQRQEQISAAIDTDRFYPGIVVHGIDLGGKTMEQAKAALKELEPTLRGKYDVKVEYDGKSWNITENDLSFTFNTDSVLKEAYDYGRSGDRNERYQKVMDLKQNPKKFEITNTMNYDGLDAKLKDVVRGITCDPVEPTVVSFNAGTGEFQFKEGKNGIAVDENLLYTRVTEILNGAKTGTVRVPTKQVPCQKSIDDIKSHLKKLGTYSTISTNNANGTHNMKRALASVNGTCIPAGGTFSFNDVVGNSNQANGYLEAGAILNGKLIKAYGGGICQASTTLYGAALRSNMQIVQRSNHTIQSTYCPIGQDAAVSYPELDFKFMNPTEYPVYIITGSNGKTLTATFYGYQSPDYDTIKITSVKTESLPAPTTPKFTVDKTLAKGVVKLDSKARDGSRATAQRVFYKNGLIVKTENLPASYYHPLPAFYSMGPETTVDMTKLPTTSSASSQTTSSKPSASQPGSSSAQAPSTPSSSSHQPAPPSSSQSTTEPSSGNPSSSEDPAADDVLANGEIYPD